MVGVIIGALLYGKYLYKIEENDRMECVKEMIGEKMCQLSDSKKSVQHYEDELRLEGEFYGLLKARDIITKEQDFKL